jgi:hypothetical protein
MSANEIAIVSQQYRRRLEAILTPVQLASFDAYQQRLQDAIARRDSAPVGATPDEQAVLDAVALDTEAETLRKQLDILLRITTPPQ